jgi:epoxyqueuosine reductase
VKILLHTCCGPCSIYPVQLMRQEGCWVMGFFYRSNIHPYSECRKREETLRSYAQSISLQLIFQPDYDMEAFFRRAAFREAERCIACYHDRLTASAKLARRGKFDAFGTTLLYSRYQQHDVIRSIGETVAKTVGVPFYYRDFRVGWQAGVDESRRLGMYRQAYCGCLYSEKERYYRGSAGKLPPPGADPGAPSP